MGGFAKFFLIIFLLALLVGVLFLLFGNKFDPTKNIYNSVFKNNSATIINTVATIDNNVQIITPPVSETWCKVQEITVPIDNEKYSRDRIIGWDSVSNCCVRQLDGFNCALLRESNVQYCFTGNIGGSVIWTNVEGYYVQASQYQAFINDLMKQNVLNKPCYLEKYPTLLKPLKQNVTTY